jgi:hypothetical protein
MFMKLVLSTLLFVMAVCTFAQPTYEVYPQAAFSTPSGTGNGAAGWGMSPVNSNNPNVGYHLNSFALAQSGVVGSTSGSWTEGGSVQWQLILTLPAGSTQLDWTVTYSATFSEYVSVAAGAGAASSGTGNAVADGVNLSMTVNGPGSNSSSSNPTNTPEGGTSSPTFDLQSNGTYIANININSSNLSDTGSWLGSAKQISGAGYSYTTESLNSISFS